MAATKTRKTNWFAIWTTVAVAVVVIGGGAVVVAINNNASSGGTPPQAANVNVQTGAVSVGTGPRQLDTYIDFMCPICNQFEQTYGPTIQQQLDAGTITLNIHPIAILDNRSQGTAYSTRAASALYCVAESEPAAVQPFVAAMYSQQPEENTPGLTNEQIVSIADGAGATSAADCIRTEKFKTFVTARTKDTPIQPGKTGIGTPTVAFDGDVISLTGNPAADITARLK